MKKFKRRAIIAENRVRLLKKRACELREEVKGLTEVHMLEAAIIGQLIEERGKIEIDRKKLRNGLNKTVKVEIAEDKIIVYK